MKESNPYWVRAINWDTWPLDEGPRPKSGKSSLNLSGQHFEGKINWFRLQTSDPLIKRRAKKKSLQN
jgi:hypothetical protein